MEGVMMRNGDRYAVAVRKPDHEIEVQGFDYTLGQRTKALRKIPVIRGVFNFIDSLYLGMSTLMYSASFFEEEEDEKNQDGKKQEEKNKNDQDKSDPAKKDQNGKKTSDDLLLGGTVALSVLMAVGIFFVVPYLISTLLQRFIPSDRILVILEGLIRLAMFIGYIGAISFMPEIRRTYMYHGAEHKSINCIEHGMDLTVENVRKSSRLHKRCGTSFLLIVMVISIFFFMMIRVDSRILRLVIRLILIPVIAGVSFEFIRLAGKSDNWFVDLLSKPGLWMQGITTREPDDDMIEVAIASVNEVFDWKKWQEEEGLR